jgi:hypothetical protein
MLRNNTRCRQVIDWEGRLVGIVTEGDLLRPSEIGAECRRSRWLELHLGPGKAAKYTAERADRSQKAWANKWSPSFRRRRLPKSWP